MLDKNTASTIAGGGAGLLLLNSVQWEAVPYGELVKLGAAFALIVAGYLMHRESK